MVIKPIRTDANQAVGLDDALATLMRLFYDIKKDLLVPIILKNRLPGPASIHDLIKSAFEFNAVV